MCNHHTCVSMVRGESFYELSALVKCYIIPISYTLGMPQSMMLLQFTHSSTVHGLSVELCPNKCFYTIKMCVHPTFQATVWMLLYSWTYSTSLSCSQKETEPWRPAFPLHSRLWPLLQLHMAFLVEHQIQHVLQWAQVHHMLLLRPLYPHTMCLGCH